MAQVEPAARLIIQSYEHRVHRGNGGRIGSGRGASKLFNTARALARRFDVPGRELYLRANP